MKVVDVGLLCCDCAEDLRVGFGVLVVCGLCLWIAVRNSRGRFGYTALMVAAMHGHRDIVELLLSKGSQVNTNGDGETAIDLACRYPDVVDLLTSHVAEYGWTGARPTEKKTCVRPCHEQLQCQVCSSFVLLAVPGILHVSHHRKHDVPRRQCRLENQAATWTHRRMLARVSLR